MSLSVGELPNSESNEPTEPGEPGLIWLRRGVIHVNNRNAVELVSESSTDFFFAEFMFMDGFLSEALRFNKALDKSDIRGPPDGVAFIDGFFGVFASLSFFVLNEQMESKRALLVDFFTDCVFGVSTLFLS